MYIDFRQYVSPFSAKYFKPSNSETSQFKNRYRDFPGEGGNVNVACVKRHIWIKAVRFACAAARTVGHVGP